jgi:hypothetical protein
MEEEVKNQALEQETASEEKPNKDVSFPRRKEKKGSKNGLRLLVIVIVIFIAGAAYYLLTDPSIDESADQLTPTPLNQVSPTPTIPVEEIIRDEISINVLNGTGLSGAAGDLKEELETLGYSNIEVGNAQSKGYESTELVFDSGVPAGVRDEIGSMLETIYDTVEVSSDSLTDVDVEITTGYPKGHEPTVTDAPASTATPTSGVTGTTTPTSSPTSFPSPTP